MSRAWLVLVPAWLTGAACLGDVTDYCRRGVDCPGEAGGAAPGGMGPGGAGGVVESGGGGTGGEPCLPSGDVEICATPTDDDCNGSVNELDECACPDDFLQTHCFTYVAGYQWGDAEEQELSDIVVLPGDDVVLVGTNQGSIDFGLGEVVAGAGRKDLFVARVDDAGAGVWSKAIGDVGIWGEFDSSEDDPVLVDHEGDRLVVGSSFTGTVDVEGATFTSTMNEYDGVVMALDATDGSVVWVQPLVGGGQTYVNDVAIAGDGVYVAAQFNDDITVPGGAGQPGCGDGTLTNGDSGDDGILLKLDRDDGTALWCLPLRTTGDDSADALARSSSGTTVWVGGKFDGTMNVPPGSPLVTLGPSGDADGYAIEVDGNGTPLRSFEVGDAPMIATSTQRVDGLAHWGDALVMVGRYRQDTVVAGSSLPHVSGDDVFIAKADLVTNDLVWGQRLAGDADELVQRVMIGADGDVYAAGLTLSFLNLTAELGFSLPALGEDGVLMRLAGDTGDYVAVRTFRASDTREFFGLGQLSSGHLVLAGSSESVLHWAQNLPPVISMGAPNVDDVVLGVLLP